MYQATFKGINAFLRESCKLLLEEGRRRITRGKVCYELPEPYMFKIEQPTSRIVTIPERGWFPILPYAESLWIASGRNDLNFIRHYLKRMEIFSDNDIDMRGGYGPRFRHYNADKNDYSISTVYPEQDSEVDQFRYILECFNEDSDTRRAVITLGDPIKDDFNQSRELKKTKDLPCTRMLHFMKSADDNKLNLIVTMRSNDLIWGASAVNIFNYTFMQEYFAAILGLEVGEYFHIVNNFHYYDDKKDKVQAIAKINEVSDLSYEYDKSFRSLGDFDKNLKILAKAELDLREKGSSTYVEFEDYFFRDWYNVIYSFNQHKILSFQNPTLAEAMSRYYRTNNNFN